MHVEQAVVIIGVKLSRQGDPVHITNIRDLNSISWKKGIALVSPDELENNKGSSTHSSASPNVTSLTLGRAYIQHFEP